MRGTAGAAQLITAEPVAAARQGASSPARCGRLLAAGETDEAGAVVDAAGRATGEEVVVVRDAIGRKRGRRGRWRGWG